jgi:uncharacterized protein YjbJ (UPF0337 family)
MNWHEIAEHWARVIPDLQQKWAKLSDEDLARPEAKRDLLASALERHYGIRRDHAELQLDRFVEKLSARGASEPARVPSAAGKEH